MFPNRELYCTKNTDCTNTIAGDTWNLTLNMEKYIPENIETSTIESKLKENQLKVTGKMKKIE